MRADPLLAAKTVAQISMRNPKHIELTQGRELVVRRCASAEPSWRTILARALAPRVDALVSDAPNRDKARNIDARAKRPDLLLSSSLGIRFSTPQSLDEPLRP
jgi:hypothetical protein